MSGSPTADQVVGWLAARHNRVVTSSQLVSAGVGHREVAHRVAAGRLYRIHRGVYLVEPPEMANRLTLSSAAVAACDPRALLSHTSAAELWGLPPRPGAIHVTVVGRNPGTRREGIRTHRALSLDPCDLRVRQRVTLTSPARTALDAATLLEPADLERLLARVRVSKRELEAVLSRYPTHPGAGALRAVMRADPALTRSEAEALLLSMIRKAKLPAPHANARLHGLEVDFLWREQRLIVEVDGFAFHADRTAFERDRERDALLVAAGYRVIRVTWRQLVNDPLVVIARIAGALTANPAYRARTSA